MYAHLKKIILLSLLLLLINVQPTFAKAPLSKKFMTLADIHFNPFIGCDKFSNPCPILNELRTTDPQSWDLIFQKYADKIKTNYHQNTDYFLLASTLTELNTLNQQQKPAFILLLGDFLAHDFPEQYKKYSGDTSQANYQAFIQKTLLFLTYKLNQVTPLTTIYPILGNCDSYNGNYKIDPNGLFLNNTATIFSTLIKNKEAQKKFQDEYPHAGYYTVTLAQKNKRLIALNSVFFSTLYATAATQKAADEQLIWLQKQLSIAQQQHQHVLIALHIPFGIDVYRNIKMRFNIMRYFSHPLFWQTAYNESFLSLLQRYTTTVVGILPAHIHNDSFQLIANDTHEYFIPISLTPSISPIYGNNPGLKIFHYNDKTFQLTNFNTYFYPISEEKSAKWKQEYDFNALYQPNCKKCLLINGMLRLKKDNSLVTIYKKYYSVSRNAQPITTENAWMPYYWCGIYNTDWKTYRACIT